MTDLAKLTVEVSGNGIKQVTSELDHLTKSSKKTEKEVSNLTGKTNSFGKSVNDLPPVLKSTSSAFTSSAFGAGLLGAALLSVTVASRDYIDSLTQVENKLRLVSDGQTGLQNSLDSTYQIAKDSRSDWADTIELYSRLSRATKELGVTQDRVSTVTKTISQLVTASGASAMEASSGIIQLSQGFASGRLQGDELRSVLENLPAVARTLARELGVTVGELRQLGAEGELTGDKLFNAFERASSKAQEEMDATTKTIEQSTTRWGNLFDKTFGGVFKYVGSGIATELDKSAERWENNIALFKSLGDTLTWGDLLKKSNEELLDIIHNTDQLTNLNNRINVLIQQRSTSVYGDEKKAIQEQIDVLKEQKTQLEDISRLKAAASRTIIPVAVSPELDNDDLIKVQDSIAKFTLSAQEFKKYQFNKEFNKLKKAAGGVTPELIELSKAFEQFQSKTARIETDKEFEKVKTVIDEVRDKYAKLTMTARDFEVYQVNAWYKAQGAVIGYTDELKKTHDAWIKSIDTKAAQKQAEKQAQLNQSILNNDNATALQQIAIINSLYDSKIAAAQKYGLDTVGIEVERSQKIQEIWNKEKIKHGSMIDGFRAGLDKYTTEAQSAYSRAETAGTTMARNLESGIGSMLSVTGQGFEDWGNKAINIVNSVLDAIMKAAVVEPLAGSITSGLGSLIGSLTGSLSASTLSAGASQGATLSPSGGAFLPRGHALGAVMSGSDISSFSNSIVSTPTFFNGSQNKAYAKGGNVMGEAGPEAILPLTRTSGGKLGVQTSGSGTGGVTVNVYNQSGQNVSAQTNTKRDSKGGLSIDVILTQIKNDVAKDISTPGTNLYSATQQAAGVNSGYGSLTGG